ncbi:G-protein signaling modulator 2 S homeolog isoform X5 [Xenopus laevis]|uniref:G-protein signaling modulator 2 S homeolog isoform X5 n=1 Tax=Xenopus laevis TaxID=8355 RepID=A0A8J0UZC0_XENLA|nr:G-protein signaling modulator 2 S homeolog isoform X5 [Xenopus laevis]
MSMEGTEALLSMREAPSFHVRYRMEASCLELALEGERLCKAGDCRAGVSFFEAAVQVGTEDLKTLSAIYSQLGNAYFYLHEYNKALEYHHHDLTLARTIGDRLGEAKASGNLGNTLKVLGNFEEAVLCCECHLEISRELYDKVGEARALYNLGNVYHSQGKSLACTATQDPGEFPEEVKTALQRAVDYYEANLLIVTDLGDRAAQGRAYGNLGNTHYLLGNFRKAVSSHEQRLLVAREYGDRSAERRAYSNLGNAFIFLGEFEMAAEYYKKTLQLARQMKDRAVEAQSCYSLGNTYTLLQDYDKAIEYHLKHLAIAQELLDRVGEGRACWSLGNAYTALGNHDEAVHFAEKHLDISRELGDRNGELTAQLNLSDLQMVLGLSYSTNASVLSEIQDTDTNKNGARPRVSRRHSMENLDIVKITPEKKTTSTEGVGEEGFFDLLSRFQSNRMDDQRCSLQDGKRLNVPPAIPSMTPKAMKKSVSACAMSPHSDRFLDLIASSQSRRLDDQRVSLGDLSGLRINQRSHSVLGHLMDNENQEPDEDFFDMLVKCQGSRLDDQRCAPPPPPKKGPTVPDEDFFSLILRSQAKRMDEQRVTLSSLLERPNSN